MVHTDACSDVFLNPGEFHFGGGGARVSTILGSCVSITAWHGGLRVGGMCHFLLPARAARGSGGADGLYADEAMRIFLQAMSRHCTRPSDYQVKLFGGANMFPTITPVPGRDIGTRNIEAARALIGAAGMQVIAEHVGGVGYRRIVMDLGNGDVWVKQKNEVFVPEFDTLPLPDFGQGRR